MSEPMEGQKVIDLELTNACNISCVFCPRHRTPKQGFMNTETFKQTVKRAEELNNLESIHFCGLGEPLFHPNVVDCVAYLAKRGIHLNITTNASLLSRELAEKLIAVGLKDITISVSGLGELYEKVHQIDFATTIKNILDFIKISDGRIKICLSITILEMNEEKIDEMIVFWEKIGIHNFILFELNNRGGALDRGYYFTKSNKFYIEAEEILAKNHIASICFAPFLSVFIGWDGDYYLCCMDYEKILPLGSVFEHSIGEIDVIKSNLMRDGCEVCRDCDTSIINIIRELLFRIEKQEASVSDLEKKIEKIKKDQMSIFLRKNQ